MPILEKFKEDFNVVILGVIVGLLNLNNYTETYH